MLEARRIATAPLPAQRGLRYDELAAAAAADALVRRAWASGRQAELVMAVASGDLASQHAFERDLAREGLDRADLDRVDLEVRVAAFTADRVALTARTLADIGLKVDLTNATVIDADVVTAARIAFVTLFEQGLVEQAERVVATCPRCRTPVNPADAVAAEHPAELVTLRLDTLAGAEFEISLIELELLPGAVAIGVAEGEPLAGDSVVLPLGAREVPVVAFAGCVGAALVVPAHDADSHALAMTIGATPISVLDDQGVVTVGGALAGLGRYAARQAARELLAAEGVLIATTPAVETVQQCVCCGGVLVPQLGRHWFLKSGDLEVAAADAVRDGLVAFQPAETREAFLAIAGRRREWCISTAIDSGAALPAAICLDCGKLTVDVMSSTSCGKCMGTLVPEAEALDARFVAAIWTLTRHDWPARRGAIDGADLALVVGESDLGSWVLPSLALGIRLTGAVPFSAVVVHPWPDAISTDVDSFLAAGDDIRVLRLALVGGAIDVGQAREAVHSLDNPVDVDADRPGLPLAADVAAAAAAGIAALDDGSPALAADLLTSALSAGVPVDAADRLRALALPILGD